ncbi:MAG: tripartite tricarboxylate transporter TctB family protein [Spirochaetia bacterium]|nr:tripartite tricarboxylate transporter TctB family protein [Spirochaetia bacterium]
MNISLLTGIVTLILGIVYTAASLILPDAAIGRVNEPKIFPTALGIFLVFLSVLLIAQQARKIALEPEKTKKIKFSLKPDEYVKKILLTALNGLLYAFLFAKAGYVISTFTFVCLELLLFSGIKRIKMCATVAIVFSLFIYILFSKMLGVYLPVTPFIWI